jgi:hypothetical protein
VRERYLSDEKRKANLVHRAIVQETTVTLGSTRGGPLGCGAKLPKKQILLLTMRLYAPKSDALTGKWNPPPVMRL